MFFLVVSFCFTVAVIKGQYTFGFVYDQDVAVVVNDQHTNCSTCMCPCLAEIGYCGFYELCVEDSLRNVKYGENPVAFGYDYCRQIEEKGTCFTSSVGQDWERNSRICLMKAILNNSSQSSATCDELEMFAFRSRPNCSIDNGFCSDILLSLDDLRCLANALEGPDFFNKLSFQQVFDTAIRCSKKNADDFLSFVDEWILNTAPSERTSKQLLQTLKDLLQGCRKGLDVMLVLDVSGSINISNFKLMIDFTVYNITPLFNIGPDDTRVGVIRYSEEAFRVIPLGFYNDTKSLQSAIKANIYYIGGGTATHAALDRVKKEFDDSSDRTSQGIPQVAIVFTDGKSDKQGLTIQAARSLHDAGIVVYSIGIDSDINKTELNLIASSSDNVFKIDDFSSKKFENVLLQLQISACLNTTIVDIFEQLEIYLEEREYRFLHYNLSFPTEKGMTLKINTSEGEVQVFGSFSIQNPTILTADFSVRQFSGCIDYYISPNLYESSTEGRQEQRCRTDQPSSNDNVYISIIGLNDENTFSLYTTTGDTSAGLCTLGVPGAALALKAVYQIPLFAVLLTIMTLLLYS